MTNITARGITNALFRDKEGKLVIFQLPNAPIVAWAALKLAMLFVADENLHASLEQLAAAVLFTWAYLEITSGASLFRRILGGLVMVVTVAGMFR